LSRKSKHSTARHGPVIRIALLVNPTTKRKALVCVTRTSEETPQSCQDVAAKTSQSAADGHDWVTR
jgi:hypothetical protein